ncbi:MAG: nucleotidyltransferase domain-containing protein [Sphingobacterium sp.]
MEIIQKEQFTDILETLAENLSITETQHNAAVKSYNAVGNWLSKDDSLLMPYNPQVKPQGSFIIGTTIQSINPDDDIDLDIVCELHGKGNDWTQSDVKRIVGQQLSSHMTYESILDDEGRRCWTLKYRAESDRNDKYHMDILPSVISHDYEILLEKSFSNLGEKDYDSLILSITDRERLDYYSETDPLCWLQSNPFGYAKWFMRKVYLYDGPRKKSFSLNEAVQPTPKYQEERLPLQRVVQLLKRHRDVMFLDEKEEEVRKQKPISCIITTLAARSYRGEVNVFDALSGIIYRMEGEIEWQIDERGKKYEWISNPVNNAENFADRWNDEGSVRRENFYRWLSRIKKDMNEAQSQRGLNNISESLKKSFGNESVCKTFSQIGERAKLLTEQKSNYYDRKVGVVGAMASEKASLSKIPIHTFDGKLQD